MLFEQSKGVSNDQSHAFFIELFEQGLAEPKMRLSCPFCGASCIIPFSKKDQYICNNCSREIHMKHIIIKSNSNGFSKAERYLYSINKKDFIDDENQIKSTRQVMDNLFLVKSIRVDQNDSDTNCVIRNEDKIMEIFIGSSKESLEEARQMALWIEELGMTALLWNKTGLFTAGQYTFKNLIDIAKKVDAAIFVFGEDDEIWYRSEIVQSVRDNVLIEFGLFCGILGLEKSILCRKGVANIPSDLNGITYIYYDGKEQIIKTHLRAWIDTIR